MSQLTAHTEHNCFAIKLSMYTAILSAACQLCACQIKVNPQLSSHCSIIALMYF